MVTILTIAVVVLILSVVVLYNKKVKFGLNQFTALRAEARATFGTAYKSVLAGAKLAIKYMPNVNFTADTEAKALIDGHTAAAESYNETANEELETANEEAARLEKQAAETRKAGKEAYDENTAKAKNESAAAKKYNDILADM